jgi:hypothetical protein
MYYKYFPSVYSIVLNFLVFFPFWWDWGLNSRLCTYKAGILLLKPHLQPILLWLFWKWGLENYF